MKKFLLLSLLALFGSAFARAEITRATLVERIETCEAILQEFVDTPKPIISARVLQNAKAIVVVNQFKAGIILGVKDGYGIIMVKNDQGRWSLPVLINAGEASLGLQLGASSINSVYVINDPALPKLLFKQRFNVGVDAKAVAGPKSAEAESTNSDFLRAPIIVYTKSSGLFAGATVKAGSLSRDDKSNFMLYNTSYTMPELLYGNWVQPVKEVVPLMQLIQRKAP